MNTTEANPKNLTLDQLLATKGPTCLIIKAKFEPVGGQDRFQPAGFPEMGHVIYPAPRADGSTEQVCIVDSTASMANHLESLCFANPTASILHPDLTGLPYVRCVTDPNSRLVVTTLSEGHRLASDYFLDGKINNQDFREVLRTAFDITKAEPPVPKKEKPTKKKKKETFLVSPENWWNIYQTIFRYDPNSLVHGILFAKEQIKISRLLTANLEAFGASRVGSSGVKFDRLGKTLSGQPIFSRDEETAERIKATFLIDLGLLRSYGHDSNGLSTAQKRLLLELALWKIGRMLAAPFRFRSGCHLRCINFCYTTEDETTQINFDGLNLNIADAIRRCNFGETPVTDVHYPIHELFTQKEEKSDDEGTEEPTEENETGD